MPEDFRARESMSTGRRLAVFLGLALGLAFAVPAAPSATSATIFGALDTWDNGILAFGVAGQADVSHDRGHQMVASPTEQNLTAARVLASGATVFPARDFSKN